MKKYILIIITIICVQSMYAEIVFDPTTCSEVISNGITAVNQLNTATNELSTVTSTLELAQQNSQMLNVSNWSDISSLVTSINAAASLAQSMTWATTDAVNNFAQLFPGDSKTNQYLQDMTRRTTGAISTFKGNLSAVQGLGNALQEYKNTLTKIAEAQGLVQGHLSAAEQSNQIQGNILNTQQSMLMSQMSASSDASAYYAYEIQQKQIEIDSDQRFLSGIDNINPNYQNNGQGSIPGI